jgi:hypothetical protein
VKKSARSIHVSVARQRLTLKRGREVERTYSISTSRFGLGSEEGSFKTPTGRFRIADKIGADEPLSTAFRARLPFAPTADDLHGDDLVMTRILWLDGLEAGNANTHSRYIYIHGTNHEELIGTPGEPRLHPDVQCRRGRAIRPRRSRHIGRHYATASHGEKHVANEETSA